MKRQARKGINFICLVGEVVDNGFVLDGKCARTRLKISAHRNNVYDFTYVDVYSSKHNSSEVALMNQTGNILYVEGEFQAIKQDIRAVPYVLVTRMVCLRRQAEVVAPDTDVIHLLDQIDPIGYLKEEKIKGGHKKNG